jgi:hypothetical protein
MISEICFQAREKSINFELLDWLRDNNFPFTAACSYTALLYNHIELFKWLIVNQCPLDKTAIEHIIYQKNFDILKWLLENQYTNFTYVYRKAYYNDEVLNWLDQSDYWDPNICQILSFKGKFDIIEKIHEKQLPCCCRATYETNKRKASENAESEPDVKKAKKN